MHDSRTVANRFLELAAQKNDTLTPMQLLKLVYIAHGWMLGLYGRALIRDPVEAWRYGPVIPTLYASVKGFKSQPVCGPLKAGDDKPLDAQEADIVSQIYTIYGDRTGIDLSRLTHKPGTPWALTYREGVFGSQISQDIIEQHYKNLASAAPPQAA